MLLNRDSAHKVLSKVKNLSAVFGVAYGSLLLSALTLPIIYRSLGVEAAGHYAVLMGGYFFASLFTDLGLSQYLIGKSALGENLGEMRFHFLFVRLLCGLALLLVTVVAIRANILNVSWLMPVFVGAFSSLHDLWLLNGQGKYRSAAFANLSGSVVYFALVAVCVPEWPRVETVFLCNMVGIFTTLVLSYWYCSKFGFSYKPSKFSFEYWRKRSILGISHRSLGAIYSMALPLLASQITTLQIVGIFSGADRLLRSIQVGTNAFSTFATRETMQTNSKSKLLQFAILATVIGSIASFFAYLFGGPVVHLFFGNKFAASAETLNILLWIIPISCLSNYLLTSVLIPRDHQMLALLAPLCGVLILFVQFAFSDNISDATEIARMATLSEFVVFLTAAILVYFVSKSATFTKPVGGKINKNLKENA